MADFKKAVRALILREGGFAESDSTAGAVKFGITQKFLSSIRGREVTKAEIKALTYEEASEVYLKHFWQPFRLGELQDQRVAEAIFDTVVNMGAHLSVLRNAIRAYCRVKGMAQPAIQSRSEVAGWLVANQPKDSTFIDLLLAARLVAYAGLALSSPGIYLRYLRGWTVRAISL